ncbi:MAG: NUDIX domain-containing protein [Promethearchaeota archaeon]|jgi:ADP-ribose pyrophosphatase YjhB (NUDIX family)
MSRTSRYQGAVIRDDHILLIKHRHYNNDLEYWIIPGGGREEGETEEECVKREIKEETNLDVVVEQLLLEMRGQTDSNYRFYKTYFCQPLSDNAQPGTEPELEPGMDYEISEVGWFDLRSEEKWPDGDIFKRFVYPVLKKLQDILGYE